MYILFYVRCDAIGRSFRVYLGVPDFFGFGQLHALHHNCAELCHTTTRIAMGLGGLISCAVRNAIYFSGFFGVVVCAVHNRERF